MSSGRAEAEYVLPLRWTSDSDLEDLSVYLGELSGWIDVTVVDGSPDPVFRRHAGCWRGPIRHVRPEPWPGANGKVRGVMTGLSLSRHERVIIADDDVRYDRAALTAVLELLGGVDLVRPQNVFTHWPWHARWDTARSLINRACGSDFPGTLAVRRRVVLEAGGYDGDVLFENLELIRTVRAAGGWTADADDLYVGRRPPSARHFFSQRVRQAYDDIAQPARLVAELALLPGIVLALRRPALLAGAGVLAVLLAELGRRREGGREAFPGSSAWWAPCWVLERSACVWLALLARIAGGIRYGEGRIRRAATPPSVLARRHRNRMRATTGYAMESGTVPLGTDKG